ncbi:MAG TPA: SRPBCC domain-containing protein [Actinocatenispora sp.]
MTQEPDQIIAAQADGVRRDLAVDRDGTLQRTVQTVSQSYPTTPEDLWQACTRPERLARWFAPVSGELRLGGRYQVEGNASGEVLACSPPRSFTVTWDLAGDTSRLTVRVEAENDRARLTIEHEHTGAAGSDFWAQFGPGATGVGWDLALLGLSLHLVGGQDRPASPDAFVQAEPARRFIRAASERWGEASVRAGTPEEDATAAAIRTTAFYLGEQPGG